MLPIMQPMCWVAGLGVATHILGNSSYAHIAGNSYSHVAGQPFRCENGMKSSHPA